MNLDEDRCWKAGKHGAVRLLRKSGFISVFICVHLWLLLLVSCGSKPTDPRTVIPADSLVYLETSDLGKALDAITSNPKFLELAKNKPDLSALNGIRLSVAVTGFQTSEEAVSEENAVLNFKPRFVAVAETNAWNYQALSFAENKLGEFVNEIYGGEVLLETVDKHGGKYFTWTANDGRRAFALVRGSLLFFGNDESAIEKCIDVLNGQTDSIAKNPTINSVPSDLLASGYIAPDGVAQIANLAGISLAKASSEEEEVQSFIARVLPEITRNSVTDVSWSAKNVESSRIEDNLKIGLKPEIGKVLSESIGPSAAPGRSTMSFLPADLNSVTRYDLKDPQIAWRSVLLTAERQTDAVSGKLLVGFSSSLFEPYGIEDPELFLQGIESEIITFHCDAEWENPILIAAVKDQEKVRKSMGSKMKTQMLVKSSGDGYEGLKSENGEIAAEFFGGGFVKIGDAESISGCPGMSAKWNQQKPNYPLNLSGRAVSVTWSRSPEIAGKIAEVMSNRKDGDMTIHSISITETSFNENGMERRTVSDFGLIGTIIAQFVGEK